MAELNQLEFLCTTLPSDKLHVMIALGGDLRLQVDAPRDTTSVYLSPADQRTLARYILAHLHAIGEL